MVFYTGKNSMAKQAKMIVDSEEPAQIMREIQAFFQDSSVPENVLCAFRDRCEQLIDTGFLDCLEAVTEPAADTGDLVIRMRVVGHLKEFASAIRTRQFDGLFGHEKASL